LLEGANRSGYFKISAVADKDGNAANQAASEYKCTAYDDYRQLIIQNQFDCLLVAAGIHSCDEYIRTAMKKKFNVLKLAPPARNFEEAAEFVRTAEEEDIKFAIVKPGRFTQSFLALQKFLQEPDGGSDLTAPEAANEANPAIVNSKKNRWEPFLVTAFCTKGSKPCSGWQSDPKLAGGGVLLYYCYEIIDQIVWNFGMPQQIYSLNSNTTGDRQQRLYLTENTVIATMKFSDTFFVNLLASSAFGPEEKTLKLYGRDKILTVSSNKFIISDILSQKSETLKYTDGDAGRLTKLLENFALSILSPGNNKLYSSGKEDLRNMAVIESAYLSARTGFPEEPGRILEIQRFGP
jgi:predicted dehydrogenase